MGLRQAALHRHSQNHIPANDWEAVHLPTRPGSEPTRHWVPTLPIDVGPFSHPWTVEQMPNKFALWAHCGQHWEMQSPSPTPEQARRESTRTTAKNDACEHYPITAQYACNCFQPVEQNMPLSLHSKVVEGQRSCFQGSSGVSAALSSTCLRWWETTQHCHQHIEPCLHQELHTAWWRSS